MPHAYCLRLPEVIWLYVIANAAIALAYFFIPPTLLLFIRKRRDIAFSWMFLLFGLFILACGTTHILDIVTLWYPIYRLDVVVRLITAVASVGTAFLLLRILPQILLLPNPQQLRDEIAKRTEAQLELEKLNEALENHVLERTATLNSSNANLEIVVKELRYQLEFNRAITTQAGDSILSTDRNGNVVFINPKGQQTFGYSADELLGRSLHNVLHVNSHDTLPAAAADCPLAIAASRGLPLHDWSTEFFRKDGTGVQVACSVGPVEVAGNRSGSVIIVRDVTERVKAERDLKERELQYRTLVDAMPQLVWSAGSDGYTNFFSKQWVQYTGRTDSDQPGLVWQSAVHPEDWEQTKQAWQSSLLSLSEYDVEHRLRRSDGCWRWFKSRAVPLLSEDGRVSQWLGTSTDIDADKRATEVLEQFTADLKNLASAMAHDLHEPLRAIATQTQLLQQYVREELAGKGVEIAGRVIANANQMRRLLQDITLYSETITRPLDLGNVNLWELIDEILLRRKDSLRAIDASVSVHVDAACVVIADFESLRFILRQLLENSIAYRRPDSDLQIEITAQLCEADVVVTFSDNGVGIKPEYYQRVFQLFKRLHNHHEHPGSGIGLAMCAKILQRHGKKIWVKSNANGGAVFYFSLQAASQTVYQEGLLNAPVAG